tara:strand:- start:717 stop:1142 length:426 start_codon:yes stop_codon:yes gene_type:complete
MVSITYLVTPKLKKSVHSSEEWYKRFDGVYISIKKTRKWRHGEFNITLDNLKKIDKIKHENPLNINKYKGEFINTIDCCGSFHTIINLKQVSSDTQKEVLEEIYEDFENKILYEDDVLEEYGWCEGDVEYEIHDGFHTQVI